MPTDQGAEGDPNTGHRFALTVVSSMSSKVGERDHTDADWWGEPLTLTVRGWSLPDALIAASYASLAEWKPVGQPDVDALALETIDGDHPQVEGSPIERATTLLRYYREQRAARDGRVMPTNESIDLYVNFDRRGHVRQVRIFDTLSATWGEPQRSVRAAIALLRHRVRARKAAG